MDQWLKNWFHVKVSRRRSASAPLIKVSRVLVVGKFPNPTFDYYFAARLSAPGMPPFQLLDIRSFDSNTVEADGTFVILIRYASKAAARWLGENRARLAGVAVFLDDDIAALVLGREASLGYRYRLMRDSILPLRTLRGMIDELWVSTETLARRHSYADPTILPPAPSLATLPVAAQAVTQDACPLQTVTLAYHATAIHVEEHRFLAPIIRQVLQLRKHAEFEVFAEGRSAKLWLGLDLDRVMVRRPLPWQKYVEENCHRSVDIMVVPVAPSQVNDCRAETKRIDIARLKAAAILSDCPAFQTAEEGEILLAYDEVLWVRQLISLIDDPQARINAALATRRRVEALARESAAGIPSIRNLGAS